MVLELMATFCAGLGAAGLMMVLGLIWKPMPRWLIPAMGGLAMIGFTIWSEYSWGDRTAGNLPEGVERMLQGMIRLCRQMMAGGPTNTSILSSLYWSPSKVFRFQDLLK